MILSRKQEMMILGAVLMVAGLARGLNMLAYPYYEADEGTYMSQAWSVVEQGKLAPYAYTYDHAPGGWLVLAGWAKAVGGWFNWGPAINTGRALMWGVGMVSLAALYVLTRKITGRSEAALIAVIVWGLAPLVIYYQRRVLLDNLMLMWVLVSASVGAYANHSGLRAIISGILMGIAIITKENAIFFIPALAYVIMVAGRNDKAAMVLAWLVGAVMPVMGFIGYAVIKRQLLPGGSISLVQTWQQQLGRSGGSIWTAGSQFWQVSRLWQDNDPLIWWGGLVAWAINVGLSWRNIPARIAAGLMGLFLVYLARGGVVLEFYPIPLTAFAALNIAVAVGWITKQKGEAWQAAAIAGVTGLAVLELGYFGSRSKYQYNLFTTNQTKAQREAIDWILAQNQPTATYVIDNYAWVDLQEKKDGHLKAADYYWKVDTDPAVKNRVGNSWTGINYLLVTAQMQTDVQNSNVLDLTKQALANSEVVKEFPGQGWKVEVRKVALGAGEMPQ